jgi:hypothetical protein
MTVSTGDANSVVNTLNIVNTDLVGVDAKVLYINVLGNWNGNLIGWGAFDSKSGGRNLVLYNLSPNESLCSTCSGSININNSALVKNNVLSLANTGSNSVTGASGWIATGNAYSSVSLLNFINSTFLNSFGFFGFINIFGSWNGNIGGKSEFAQSSQSVNVEGQTSQDQLTAMESGGMLSVEQNNNVGKYVLPGDTVTFSIKVKNSGFGKVYGSSLFLSLFKNGDNIGGASYDLGDISKADEVDISTGIVLPKDLSGGEYTARAYVLGTVGPNNATVTAAADSYLTVFGTTEISSAANSSNLPKNSEKVLGAHYPLAVKDEKSNDYGPLYALVTVIMAYIALRGIREKDKMIVIFGKRVTLEERMRAFKMFLM